MNSLIPIIGTWILMYLGYAFYSKHLAVKVFKLDDSAPAPSVVYEDGQDYVPTHKAIVFNHHFASIAGLSPIMGPAIAVIWGWLPAVLWLIFGAVFMGAVHDFAALVLSLRNRGRSIGEVANNLIGHRARILFLLIIFFAISLAMGMFTKIIAQLFQAPVEGLNYSTYPEAAFPAVMLMVIAMACGFLLRKNTLDLISVSVIGTVLTFICIWLGTYLPFPFTKNEWIYLLLAYCFAASVLPVWMLLQPRDFINAFTLYIGMILMYAGIMVSHPPIVAPALNPNPSLPSMIPLLFVVIACGAISGFHSLIASGTTAKQLAKESDARLVGYGAMIAECALGILAVIACTAGMKTQGEWYVHYDSWAKAGGLGPTLTVFIDGGARFISTLGAPHELAATFVALIIVSFALTTLDSGTRILRYNVEEIGDAFHIPILNNRYVATFVAIVAIWFLAVSPYGTKLWVLFGVTNQLLAGLVLLAATVYLIALKRPSWVVSIPMILMLIITLAALLMQISDSYHKNETAIIVMGVFILALALGLIVEVVLFFKGRRQEA